MSLANIRLTHKIGWGKPAVTCIPYTAYNLTCRILPSLHRYQITCPLTFLFPFSLPITFMGYKPRCKCSWEEKAVSSTHKRFLMWDKNLHTLLYPHYTYLWVVSLAGIRWCWRECCWQEKQAPLWWTPPHPRWHSLFPPSRSSLHPETAKTGTPCWSVILTVLQLQFQTPVVESLRKPVHSGARSVCSSTSFYSVPIHSYRLFYFHVYF